MKKAKIMLMAIAVLGIVGGAIAFKAKSKFAVTYMCYTTNTINPAATCTLHSTTFLTGVPGVPTGIKYTLVTSFTVCTQDLVNCPLAAKTTSAGPQ